MSITVEPICDSGTMPQQQPASHNNKRHTKPCVYYQTNSCPLSPDECDFAHVIAPADLPYPLKAPSSTLRSKPCRFFVTGSCKQGVWCRFKHPAILAGAHQTDDIDLDSKRKKSWDDIIEEGGTIDYEKQKDDDAIDVRDIAPEWQAERSQHPKYRTRPCRNYYLGKCLYGDKCSYVHVLSLQQQQQQRQLQQQQQVASWPAPLITSPATSPKWPTAPGFQPPPPSPNMYPSPIEPSPSPFDPDSHSTDASSFASTPDIPSLPPVIEERTDNSRRQMRGPPTSITVLPNQQAYPQSYIQSPQGPMTIVHVPVAVPMFPQMVGQYSQRRAARPRSMSQPATTGSQGQGHRSVYYKTKPCRYFNADGNCPKGDKCTFIHSKVSNPPIDEASGNEDSETKNTPGNDRNDNYHKVNWRVLGGGVMIGGNTSTEHGRRRSLDRVTHREFRQRNPEDVDIDSMSDVTCAFFPECPHGDECSFKHVDCEAPGEPDVDTDKTPTSAKSGRKVRMRPNSIEVSRNNVPLLITSPTAITAPSADEREKENRRDSRGWISTKENMKVRPLSIAVPPMTKDVVVTSPTQPFHDTSAKEKLKARPLSIAVPPMRPSYVPTSPTQARHDTGEDGDDEGDGDGEEQEESHEIENIVLRSPSSLPTPGVETVVVQSPGPVSISA